MMEFSFVPAEERWNYRELLLLADPEEQAVRRYLDDSDMFVLGTDSRVVCEAVIRMTGNRACELMNLATCEEEQGKGYGKAMVRWLIQRYASKCDEMLVGTSEDGRDFYRQLGFRDAFVRERFFIDHYEEPIIENGKRCIDMYCLRLNFRRELDMATAYCNSAEEIRSMIARDDVYARAMEKAIEKDAYWRKAFSDDASRLSGWGHNFVCPECAGHMKMDHDNYNPGGEYVCSNCGKTGVGKDLDEAWVYYYRYDSAHDLLSSALIYHMNGDQGALDYIIRYVDFYAANYADLPVHGQHAGVGKITSQSLDEAVWAMAVMRALFVCGKDAFTAEKLEYWMTNLFRPLCEFIQAQVTRIHNIPLWLQSAVGVIAIFFDDEKMLESAVESQFG
ncbi:MAG: GNAT family N-acetyltransferase, partial [Clostridia bacterium]|nr:GNAT family N-acetyltransferase [Clostridia bacterium]